MTALNDDFVNNRQYDCPNPYDNPAAKAESARLAAEERRVKFSHYSIDYLESQTTSPAVSRVAWSIKRSNRTRDLKHAPVLLRDGAALLTQGGGDPGGPDPAHAAHRRRGRTAE